MDNDYDYDDYNYEFDDYDYSDNQQQLDNFDEDNIDIYEDYNEFDECEDYIEDCQKQEFIANIGVCDERIANKAIFRSNLCGKIHIRNTAYLPSGEIDNHMFGLYSNENINLTEFWNIFNLIKIEEDELLYLARYRNFTKKKK